MVEVGDVGDSEGAGVSDGVGDGRERVRCFSLQQESLGIRSLK